MPVNAELRRKNATGDLVDYVLVDDDANPETGLADPSIDYGTRTRLDTVVTKLEALLDAVATLLTNGELRAAPLSIADINGLVPKQYDHMDLTYTGPDVTQVVYKQAGTTVATLTLGYTGGNLTSASRT